MWRCISTIGDICAIDDREKQGGDWLIASANTYETKNKTTQMRPNQSPAILRAIPFYIHTPPMDELFCGVPLSRDFLRGPTLEIFSGYW